MGTHPGVLVVLVVVVGMVVGMVVVVGVVVVGVMGQQLTQAALKALLVMMGSKSMLVRVRPSAAPPMVTKRLKPVSMATEGEPMAMVGLVTVEEVSTQWEMGVLRKALWLLTSEEATNQQEAPASHCRGGEGEEAVVVGGTGLIGNATGPRTGRGRGETDSGRKRRGAEG